jgi:ubiquinone/menaquinone biosynthesis C-methylase UbiE
MPESEYLMESEDESLRLEIKTDWKTIKKQASWAGLKPGMRVIDIGCGSGKPTYYLNKIVESRGSVIGIDNSLKRIEYAQKNYSGVNIEYKCRDFRSPLSDLGKFDFIWIRFVLEYFRSSSLKIVENVSKILSPGGILCLIDLDHNCLNHYGHSAKLERTIFGVMQTLQKEADFDPFAGRKLYSYLFDLGYEEINIDLQPHHLIFGKLRETDAFNWMKKAEVAARKSGYQFEEYEGGFEEFFDEFKDFFYSKRRFTYTPIIACRGRKPI